MQVTEAGSGAAQREAREKLLARRREIDGVLVFTLFARHPKRSARD